MKLIIQSVTPNLKSSIAFYTKLGFSNISSSGRNCYSDGMVTIEINHERTARLAIKLFSSNWKRELEALKEFSHIVTIENGYLLADPSGVWVYLIHDDQTLDDQKPIEKRSHLGKFAGISLESVSMEQSIQFWEILGFKLSIGGFEKGWAVLNNQEGMSISIMKPFSCPHLFFNPSLSFFNGPNNIDHIKMVRSLDIPITEEITLFNKEGIVDNIIIRDPGGLGFFIFSD